MNGTQVQTTLAPLVAFLAGLLAGKGVFGLDAATWATVIGAVFAGGATIWGAIAAKKSSLVTTVAAMPEVSEVTLDRTVAGSAALNSATPSNVVSK